MPLFIVFTICTLGTDRALAQDLLSNTEIYSKCYARISDFPVDMNSADYKNIAAGKLNPVTACMNLLKKAMFKTNGNKRVLPQQDEISKSILRNFNQFHLSWFSSLHSSTNHDPLHAFVDNTEPGLFLTDALFGNKHYKTVTTAKYGLRGIREANNPSPYYVNTMNMDTSIIMVGPMVTVKPPLPLTENYQDLAKITNRVPTGLLIGIEPAPAVNVPLPPSQGTNSLTEKQHRTFIFDSTSANLTKHYGGGILGSPSLFLNNVEQYGGMDGGLRVHRRWANNIFYDLLCSTLPSLGEESAPVRAEHAAFSKQKTELSFRGAKTCLTCHTTIDNLAHVARNVHAGRLGSLQFIQDFQAAELTPPGKSVRAMFFVNDFKPRLNAITPIDSDNVYHRREPSGAVHYVDLNNKLVSHSVKGLQGYGEVLAQYDDIYACAAKRYYHFLTGIDVGLKAPSASDKFATYHRNQVVNLGKALKSNGSLSTMIQSILNSNAFKARNPAEVGEK